MIVALTQITKVLGLVVFITWAPWENEVVEKECEGEDFGFNPILMALSKLLEISLSSLTSKLRIIIYIYIIPSFTRKNVSLYRELIWKKLLFFGLRETEVVDGE